MVENLNVSTISRRMDYLNMLSQNTRSMGNQRDSTLNLTGIGNETHDQDIGINDINLSKIEHDIEKIKRRNKREKSIEGIDKVHFLRKFDD